MGNQEEFRAIALRPEDRILFEDVDLQPRLQKSSTACLACRKRRRKCNGVSPCDSCRLHGTDCVIDEESDGRRRILMQRKIDTLEEDNKQLLVLFGELREADEKRAHHCFSLIRANASLQDIRQQLETKPTAISQIQSSPDAVYPEQSTRDMTEHIGGTGVPEQLSENPLLEFSARSKTSTADNDCHSDTDSDACLKNFPSCKLNALRDTVAELLSLLEEAERYCVPIVAVTRNVPLGTQLFQTQDTADNEPSETAMEPGRTDLGFQGSGPPDIAGSRGVMDIAYLTSMS